MARLAPDSGPERPSGDAHPAFRGVKIVCTIGPACADPETLRAMIRAGMNVARLNFSHGSFDEHRARAETIRELARQEGGSVALLQDLRGPKIRIGPMREGTTLEAGGAFELTRGAGEGGPKRAFVDDALFFEEIEPGDRLLLADGSVELRVRERTEQAAVCEVIAGGPLPGKKGINVPRGLRKRTLPTPRDLEDLARGAELDVDLVGVSFVRDAEDVRRVRRAMRELNVRRPLVAKIETAPAIENLDAILDVTDAVMLARGDLALETPFERVPIAQKRILEAARHRGRPVITATQMLASMVSQPRPTRAEVNDVANAILDGTDALMLSEETAVGRHPARAVETMARIAEATEGASETKLRGPEGLARELYDLGVVAEAAARAARQLEARACVVWTRGGLGARLLARAGPGIPIVAPTPSPQTARQLAVVRGVVPLVTSGPEVDPAAVRALLGKRRGETLIVLGHELDDDGRRVAWMRTARLDHPSAWQRDPNP